MKSLIRLWALLALFMASVASAQDDADGCKDHPLFNRLPGYYINDCQQSQFDAVGLPTARSSDGEVKYESIEGAVTALHYNPREEQTPASALQVIRNYSNAVKAGGGQVIAEFPDGAGCANWGSDWCADRSATLKLNKGGREVWSFVMGNSSDMYLLIVERAAMKQDIAVNELLDKINKDGFVALYINFDTGKATIKPDSNKVLDDVAAALKSAPDMKLEVGGHTDNVGAPESNLKLSDDRAKAVVAALVARGIAASRLTAKGYGQTAPVADNRSEDGRAKNRRVELTKR